MNLKQEQCLSVCITVSTPTLAAMRRQIHGCESCSTQAVLPLAQLLMRLTGRGSAPEDYVFSDDIDCPSCTNPLDSHTLVEIQLGMGRAAAMRTAA